MDSEVDLDEQIKQLHLVATAPHLYPELVRLNTVPSLLGLLAHENTDIVVDVLGLLDELTEPDIFQESEESLQLIEALVCSGTGSCDNSSSADPTRTSSFGCAAAEVSG